MAGLEALAIIGGINDASDILSRFFKTVMDYVDLPERVLFTWELLLGCEFELKAWKRTWGVEERRRHQYYEKFWGPDGSREVRRVLGILKGMTKKIKGEINKLIPCTVLHGGYQPQNEQDSKQSDEKLVIESVRRISKNMFKRRRFLAAVKQLSSRVDGQIRDFEKMLKALNRISWGFADRLHDLSGRHAIGSSKTFLPIASSERSANQTACTDATQLHSALKASRQMTCYLGLTVQSSRGRSADRNRRISRSRSRSRSQSSPPVPDPVRDYQILLKDGSTTQEVLLRPARFKYSETEEIPRSEYCVSFAEVLDEFNRSVEVASFLMPPSSPYREGFTAYKTAEAQLEAMSTMRSLSSQLGWLYVKEKIQIAYVLAEGYFRLLGSPWPDYVDSDNIRIRQIVGRKWAALLHARLGNSHFKDVLDRAEENFRRSYRSLKQHCQIYRLGILLTELALGRQISFLHFHRNDGVKIALSRLERNAGLDAEFIAAEVGSAIDINRYGDVVHFCLSTIRNRDNIVPGDFDAEFELHVLEP